MIFQESGASIAKTKTLYLVIFQGAVSVQDRPIAALVC